MAISSSKPSKSSPFLSSVIFVKYASLICTGFINFFSNLVHSPSGRSAEDSAVISRTCHADDSNVTIESLLSPWSGSKCCCYLDDLSSPEDKHHTGHANLPIDSDLFYFILYPKVWVDMIVFAPIVFCHILVSCKIE